MRVALPRNRDRRAAALRGIGWHWVGPTDVFDAQDDSPRGPSLWRVTGGISESVKLRGSVLVNSHLVGVSWHFRGVCGPAAKGPSGPVGMALAARRQRLAWIKGAGDSRERPRTSVWAVVRLVGAARAGVGPVCGRVGAVWAGEAWNPLGWSVLEKLRPAIGTPGAVVSDTRTWEIPEVLHPGIVGRGACCLDQLIENP
jgi:hypothetical protein